MGDLAAYRACLKQAASQAGELMQRCLRAVEASLPDRSARAADAVERQRLHEAVAALKPLEPHLLAAYPQELLAEFTRAATAPPAAAAALSFAELELVDDEQVQERVEVLRVQQAVLGAVEAERVHLDSLVCAAQGLVTVQRERNPLGPDAYVRSLRAVVQRSPAPPQVRLRWLQYLGEALGPELARSYAQLCAFLRAEGVTEAGFKVLAQPQTTPPTREPATLLTVDALRRLLGGGAQPAAPAPAGQVQGDFSETVPAAAEVLQEIRHPDAVLRRLREREQREGPAGSAGYRAALQSEVRTPGQAVALEVVSLMVENVAGDARLLAPVRDAVRALEPALLRLALADSRFFSDRRHPARQLLEEMTSRSLAWAAQDEPGFDAFMAPLREAVQALVDTHVTGAEPYAFALDTLEEAWSRDASRDRRRRERAVRSLLHAEQRNVLAARLAQEVAAREDLDRVSPELTAFLRGPWVQVMAQAQLAAAQGDADPGGYRAAVPILIRSSQPHTTPQSITRLQQELPGLVETLRNGLRSVGYPDDRIARFFDRLAQIHQQALKGQAAAGTQQGLDRLLDLEGGEGGAWLAPQEAQDTGYVESANGVGRPLFEATEQAGGGRATAVPTDQPRPLELQPGQWVELMLDGRWGRWRVDWASPEKKLLLFAGAGGRTRSMTPVLAGLMADSGMLRLVASGPVLEQALDAVADAALRNTAEEPPDWSWTRDGDR
ncbi:MAG TPA: DUF1631 family protein [Ramlibacter sp.]|nr:DUF1631 family protein [Ramlibacter sp.]